MTWPRLMMSDDSEGLRMFTPNLIVGLALMAFAFAVWGD